MTTKLLVKYHSSGNKISIGYDSYYPILGTIILNKKLEISEMVYLNNLVNFNIVFHGQKISKSLVYKFVGRYLYGSISWPSIELDFNNFSELYESIDKLNFIDKANLVDDEIFNFWMEK
ncbi:hypothetical protein AVV36_gp034 [Pectobacterium bacteriophage PM2]|uniref:Uncharacterized protein n=1 Tax=Pectobacterium bacteriophage PM2 TaxID=1429794 RepID=A0A0A0Q0A3_9CAUD|nr:hypothetical protein AVV36_gp034 [Pectobacterium bacteriophage PM2]AHY24996.1 hypothetical protein PM2_034 [Pectobacterium bacteriophage PM2]